MKSWKLKSRLSDSKLNILTLFLTAPQYVASACADALWAAYISATEDRLAGSNWNRGLFLWFPNTFSPTIIFRNTHRHRFWWRICESLRHHPLSKAMRQWTSARSLPCPLFPRLLLSSNQSSRCPQPLRAFRKSSSKMITRATPSPQPSSCSLSLLMVCEIGDEQARAPDRLAQRPRASSSTIRAMKRMMIASITALANDLPALNLLDASKALSFS